MLNREKFDDIKAKMSSAYSEYINEIYNFSFDDVKDFDKRMILLDSYIKTIETNTTFIEMMRQV